MADPISVKPATAKVPPKPGVVGVAKPPPPPKPKFPPPIFKGEPGESIIPAGFRHLVFVTGIRGIGKSHFLCSIENPANVLYLDFESKGESIASDDNLNIENYFSICDDAAELIGFAASPIWYYERTRQILEAMPPGRFTTLLLDNAALLQQGVYEEVARMPSLYGVDEDRKGGAEAWGGLWVGVRTVLRGLFSVARAKGVKVIAVSFQLTEAWKDNKPVWGKLKTTDVKVWHELSVLTLVLVPGLISPPKPAALVMKEQLAKAAWNKVTKRVDIQRRLPFKLPIAEMSEIYNYLEHPANFTTPALDETPKPGELDPYLPTFSREQLQMQLKMMEAAAKLNLDGAGTEE